MDKKTIIKLALVLAGIFVLITSLKTTISQLIFLQSAQAGHELKTIITEFILYFIFSFGSGLILVFKPDLIISLLFKNIDNENKKTEINISKSGVLQMSLIIISLYYLVASFPSFISNIYVLSKIFVTDFTRFNVQAIDYWPFIIWYILIIIVFFNNKAIANYLYKKLKI